MITDDSITIDTSPLKKLPVNQHNLKKAWEASQRSTKDDWLEWIRRFSVELLKESPSHALRSCASLASIYYPLARELFNAAFVSCWGELYDQFQDELVRSLELALTSPNVPAEIIQTLLNLAEFLEHDDKALPIDVKTLGAYANKCHAFAKALHYKEFEYMNSAQSSIIESLISINNQLQQPDAAAGILLHSQYKHGVQLKESWYEKLQRWDDALLAYQKRLREEPESTDAFFGVLRCRHALGDWEQLSKMCQDKWSSADEEMKAGIAPLAAASSWGLGQWESMDDYLQYIKPDYPDGAFCRAILSIHRNLYSQAEFYIERTRDLLDNELTALLGESYNRAYNAIVRVQMLAELEEIILFKQSYDNPKMQNILKKTWSRRLEGCQRNVDVWQRVLKVRALVISPHQDLDSWIKYANLCRKSNRFNLSQKILTNLLGIDYKKIADLEFSNAPHNVAYAYLKHCWVSGDKGKTLEGMRRFTRRISENADDSSTSNKLLSRCYYRLGQWEKNYHDHLESGFIPELLDVFMSSIKHDENWYKAWHGWALTNFEVISFYEKQESLENQNDFSSGEWKNITINYIVPAVQGFFRSISLSKGKSLQDTLRLLTLWFKYGSQQEVNAAISEGFENISIDTWLQVIPQIIARIHVPSSHVRRLVSHLLAKVGKEHPQALIYSLTVASKSTVSARKNAASAILDKLKVFYPQLVEQALLVSQELIRVAILWHEMWHEGLEEASRFYFGDKNIEAMLEILEPLHQMMERGPETIREISFNQSFGRDLQEAFEWTLKYRKSGNVNDLNQAWDLYYHVFRKINKQLPQLTILELQYVSPKLFSCTDLELAVPGSYKANEPLITIKSFNPSLCVITSKQRPRKLVMKGSNGVDYQYLLKGHEDLRQDERVMQLFGLVNTLLDTDPETFKRHLNIQRFPIIPLSQNSGLIGWVPHCDTIHALIRDYRDARKILLNVEHRMMLQMAPDYDNLTSLQKIEVFDYTLKNTLGTDLQKVFWLKSKNSEAWLDRRTTYTRSLAVMSIVGYVLGLGDRHPSNLMIDKVTGKVIHIDFGDCFEVAMNREKFPEKIPFRLTRMLINAMEVSGIEGTFRITCENVMRVLRLNKDSLMAVLEAFVYDPLINWRLLTASPRMESIKKSDIYEEEIPKNFPSSRKYRKDHLVAEDEQQPEVLNTKALSVINRISNKLTGRDFKSADTLDEVSQVEKLIEQATSIENLSQCYIGWCPFW